MPPIEVTQLLRKVSEDQNSEAAAELWALYHPRLLRIARNGLSRLPDDAIEDEDIVQSSMNSFFKAAKRGRVDKVESRHELWKFLLTITMRKLNRQFERVNSAKLRHDKVSLDAAGIEIAKAPGDELFMECDELLRSLKDDHLKTVAIMRLEGYTVAEIAEELEVARATVKRRLSRIRELWSAEAEDE